MIPRDFLARYVLAKIGLTPNRMTVLGGIFMCIAGYCLARGAETHWYDPGRVGCPWPYWAAWWMIFACAMDMLDGAMAKLCHMSTRFGGILDSTVDRVADIALYAGCMIAFGRVHNTVFEVLALIGLTNAVLISYVKARADAVVGDFTVGFWQRGERMVGFLVGGFSGHMATAIAILSLVAMFSVFDRLLYTYKRCQMLDAGRDEPVPAPFWRKPRGTWWHTGTAALYILLIAFVDVSSFECLRPLFDGK